MVDLTKIESTAAAVRESGIPDCLNLWMTMTPDEIAAAQRRAARLTKDVNDRRIKNPPRRMSGKASGLGMSPMAMRAAGAKLKSEGSTMKPPQPGSKESQVRDLRLQRAAGTKIPAAEKAAGAKAALKASTAAKPEATAPANQMETTMKSSAKKKPVSKKAPKKSVARKGGTKTASKASAANARKTDGVRPGSKLALVVGLLQRPEGCTTAEVLKICDWPAVSMPQMAKSAGLTLKQEKDGRVTRYWDAATAPKKAAKTAEKTPEATPATA